MESGIEGVGDGGTAGEPHKGKGNWHQLAFGFQRRKGCMQREGKK